MLSISRNAAEWLADLNDSVTLLLSPMANVFNGDTECYLEIFQMVTLSVKHHSWIPSLSIEKP